MAWFEKAYLLLPLLAAILYAAGALAMKTAGAHGIDSRRSTLVCNAVVAVMFLLFYDWTAFPSLPDPVWPVCVSALLVVLGQWFMVLAINSGEVSCVTPVLGVKVILVSALAAFVAGAAVNAATWGGAVLAVAGIVFLQVDDRTLRVRDNLRPLGFAFLCALCLAGFDTMTQYWSPRMGFGQFVPPAMLLAAVLSAGLLLRGHTRQGAQNPAKPVRQPNGQEEREGQEAKIGRGGWYLLVGASLLGVQSVVIISAIGYFGDAAGANVVYSSRGLWGLGLLWLVGHWFHNQELVGRGRKVVLARVAGAGLIAAAVVLLFL